MHLAGVCYVFSGGRVADDVPGGRAAQQGHRMDFGITLPGFPPQHCDLLAL